MEKSYEDRNWANDFLYFFKNLWIAGVSIVLGIAMVVMLIANLSPVYRVSATYYLNKSELNSAFFTINEFQFYNLLLLDIEQLIGSRSFFNEVKAVPGVGINIDDLTMEEYLENLYIEIKTDSTFFKVGYDSSNAEFAMSVSKRIELILSRESAKIVHISTVENVDSSYLSEEPVAPNKVMLILLGAIMGAFIGMSVILVKFLVNGELKTYIEAEIITGKKVLSYSKYNMKKRNIMHLLNTMNNEDYHKVWQNILNDTEQFRQRFCTVLTCDDTGKNEAFALTLAHYMGKTFEKTLFIPVNPSEPFSSILTYSYGHENRLIKALLQNEPLSKLIRNVSYSFDILIGTDNRINFNLETMNKFDTLLDEIEKTYDLVIVSVSTEERLLNSLAKKGPVILAASNNSSRSKVRHVVSNFEVQDVRFLGIAFQE